MRNAAIAQAGTPEELYTQPESVFVATFMGEANNVQGTIERCEGGQAQIALGPLRLALPDRGLPAGRTELVIRPEAIRFAADGEAGLPATVQRATYMGSHSEYLLDTAIGTLFAVIPDRLRRRAVGAQVLLALAPDGVMLVRD
jgi:iron(III) transport system ATP-binding protein